MMLEMNTQAPRPMEAYPEPELVSLAKAGNARAFTALSDRYMPVLQSRAGRYSNIVGVDVEDFVQEGMLALYRAVMGYDGRGDTRFSTYAITCINNSMTTAIKNHMKVIQKGSSVNLDDLDELGLLRQMTQRHGQTMEDLYIELETSGRRAQQIETLLSDFERRVLKLYLSGHSYQRISNALSTTTKAVDNALQRVRRKLRPEL